MGIGNRFCCWWSLLVLCLSLFQRDQAMSSEIHKKSCHPSSCGTITNISYPFRLQHDPPHCGNLTLSCENNLTILQLDLTILQLDIRRYKVLGIHYNNYTIRLVDEGIQKGNCSSLPLYSLSLYNFKDYESSYRYYEEGSEKYSTSVLNSEGTEFKLFKHVGYLECSDPVRDDPSYVDTSPCINWKSYEGGYYLYVVAGDLVAEQFKPQCSLKLVTLIDINWESLVPNYGGRMKKRYGDIHEVISYGFELSWWRQGCADLHCPDNTYCDFSPESQRPPRCLQYGCVTPLGIEIKSCGTLSKLRIFGEDYVFGIWNGLLRIMKWDRILRHTDYNSEPYAGPSKLLIKFGEFTGNFVLPFIVIRFFIGIVLLSALLIYTCCRRHLSIYEDIEDFIRLHDLIPIRYSYKELKTMTEGFKNKLGEGGFGTVYKGKLRSGPEVAIKMLGKSKANDQEFISEVATIGRIHHFNVVHLVGFCVEATKRALVYEFMPNGSLDKHIFSKEENTSLSCHKIYEISLGVARGIAYLHHGCEMQILHFDIKPHNILLDDNFKPKISDFGLARSYSIGHSIVTLTAARGTRGYMAPELFYNNIGRVSDKTDVYSFGMLLIEMVSRRRNLNPHVEHSSQRFFHLWIYDHFDEEKDVEIKYLTEDEKDLVRKMFIIALWCTQLKPIDRPSMNKVIEMLEVDDVSNLEMPPKPSIYPNETVLVDDGPSSCQTTSINSVRSYYNSSGVSTGSGK